jgi:hypothetical protein
MKIDSVKQWQKLSHGQKRSAKVKINGVKTRLIDYADSLAKKLPDILDSTDNMKPVNHKKLIRESMMDSGTEGVHKYYNGVLKMHSDQLLLLTEMNKKLIEETEAIKQESNDKAIQPKEESELIEDQKKSEDNS